MARRPLSSVIIYAQAWMHDNALAHHIINLSKRAIRRIFMISFDALDPA